MTPDPAPQRAAQAEASSVLLLLAEMLEANQGQNVGVYQDAKYRVLNLDPAYLRLLAQPSSAQAPASAENETEELPAYLREFAKAMSEVGRNTDEGEYIRCLETTQKRLADSMARSDSLWLNNFEVPVMHRALLSALAQGEQALREEADALWTECESLTPETDPNDKLWYPLSTLSETLATQAKAMRRAVHWRAEVAKARAALAAAEAGAGEAG